MVRTQDMHRSVFLKNKKPLVFSRIHEVVTRELHIEDSPSIRRLVESFASQLLGQLDMQDMDCQTDDTVVVINAAEA